MRQNLSIESLHRGLKISIRQIVQTQKTIDESVEENKGFQLDKCLQAKDNR